MKKCRMYRSLLFIFLILLCTMQSMAQSKQDYSWLWGGEPIENSPNYSGVKFQFGDNGINVIDQWMGGDIFRQVGLMSDKETGELLFYTNGCSVYNREHREMPNGDKINDTTPLFDWFCPGGYAASNNSMVLSDPGNDNGYYIIHKPFTQIPEEQNRIETLTILYTYVDMELDDGKGDVSVKNQIAYNEKVTNTGFLNACRHANGRDWWILQALEDSNIYISILLTENGFEIVNEQAIGPLITNNDGAGQTTYSRDGSLFVVNSYLSHVLIFDFDRTTGLLSNDRKVIIEDTPDLFEFNRGAAFSPNDRYLYTTTQKELFQIDLHADDLEESIILIDTFANRADGFDSYFNQILTGPDCKMYITAVAGTQFMHVIHSPDERGEDCDFQQDGIEAPRFMPGSFSYIYPHWRIDEDQPCDATMVGLADVYGVDEIPYKIYPNPVRDVAILEVMPEAEIVRYELLSVDGKIVRSAAVDELQSSIDVSELGSGMYFLRVYDVDGAWEVEKVVKE